MLLYVPSLCFVLCPNFVHCFQVIAAALAVTMGLCFQVTTAALAVTSQFVVSLGSIRMRLPSHSVRTVHQGSTATTHTPLSPCTTAVTALKVGLTGKVNILLVMYYWCTCTYISMLFKSYCAWQIFLGCG